MVYTGGELNKLNGQCGVSDPSQSVHVMSLIRAHDPDNPDELERLIREHHESDCSCGTSSGGTVEDFGRWLYEAQDEYWGEYRYSLDECIDWEYDLFVMQSLKGHQLESKAMDALADYPIRQSNRTEDDEYRVDLVVDSDDGEQVGIQVKPVSYKQMRQSVKWQNEQSNEQFDGDVYYLFYDYDDESFTNIDRIRQVIDQ